MVWAGNLTKVPDLDLCSKYEQSVNKMKKSLTTSNRQNGKVDLDFLRRKNGPIRH